MVTTQVRLTLIDGSVLEEYVSDEYARSLYAWNGRDYIQLARLRYVDVAVAMIEIREAGSEEWHLAWKRKGSHG